MVIQALDFFKHSYLYYAKVPNTFMSIKYNLNGEEKNVYIFLLLFLTDLIIFRQISVFLNLDPIFTCLSVILLFNERIYLCRNDFCNVIRQLK